MVRSKKVGRPRLHWAMPYDAQVWEQVLCASGRFTRGRHDVEGTMPRAASHRRFQRGLAALGGLARDGNGASTQWALSGGFVFYGSGFLAVGRPAALAAER